MQSESYVSQFHFSIFSSSGSVLQLQVGSIYKISRLGYPPASERYGLESRTDRCWKESACCTKAGLISPLISTRSNMKALEPYNAAQKNDFSSRGGGEGGTKSAIKFTINVFVLEIKIKLWINMPDDLIFDCCCFFLPSAGASFYLNATTSCRKHSLIVFSAAGPAVPAVGMATLHPGHRCNIVSEPFRIRHLCISPINRRSLPPRKGWPVKCWPLLPRKEPPKIAWQKKKKKKKSLGWIMVVERRNKSINFLLFKSFSSAASRWDKVFNSEL